MSGTPDVAVVGGGIVGTAAAAFLADAGARVRLYERTEIAAGASGRNSGIVQHPFDPSLAGLYRVTIAEYRALAVEVDGFGLPSEPAGLLYV
ncbi:MAG TPA: FAD-dependent oxidoreductase, partial [Candidatus Limnocylindrales bacterium]|nr:FAD-dependent oxidoreductase [Candidatus Limnocylindrales bacterium]